MGYAHKELFVPTNYQTTVSQLYNHAGSRQGKLNYRTLYPIHG